jgi:hypothetical protein
VRVIKGFFHNFRGAGGISMVRGGAMGRGKLVAKSIAKILLTRNRKLIRVASSFPPVSDSSVKATPSFGRVHRETGVPENAHAKPPGRGKIPFRRLFIFNSNERGRLREQRIYLQERREG